LKFGEIKLPSSSSDWILDVIFYSKGSGVQREKKSIEKGKKMSFVAPFWK
jgi:hypothetical protein